MLSLIPFNINGYSTTTNNSNTSDDDNRIASVIGDSETDLEESTSSEPEYTFFVNCINGTSIELGENGEPGESNRAERRGQTPMDRQRPTRPDNKRWGR